MSSTTRTGSSEIQGRLWGARAGDWADLQEPTCAPLFVRAFDVAGVRRGTRLLDAGSGSGYAAAIAADRGAAVTGLDASAPFVEIARARVPGAEFHVGEIEELPFADDSFDVVTGFNSFQYATSPQNAVREARRVTKDGGTVVIAVWGNPEENEAADYIAALGSQLPAPPPGAPGPFALSVDGALHELAAAAGLVPGALEDVPTVWDYPSHDVALRALLSSGPAVRAIEHSGEDAVRAAVTASLAPFVRGDGHVVLRNSFRFLTASA